MARKPKPTMYRVFDADHDEIAGSEEFDVALVEAAEEVGGYILAPDNSLAWPQLAGSAMGPSPDNPQDGD